MKASKFLHNNEERIKVDAPYNRDTIVKLKQIPEARWSKTLQVWHLPYTKQAFEQLKNLFPDIEYPRTKSNIAVTKALPVNKRDELKNITIEVAGRRIFLKMPKNNIDIQFIRSFRYARWDKASFHWVIPHYTGNLDLLKGYFKDRIVSLTIEPGYEVQTTTTEKRKIGNQDVLLIKTSTARLKVIFNLEKELADALKEIPYKQWDAKNKWWTIPYSEFLWQRYERLHKH